MTRKEYAFEVIFCDENWITDYRSHLKIEQEKANIEYDSQPVKYHIWNFLPFKVKLCFPCVVNKESAECVFPEKLSLPRLWSHLSLGVKVLVGFRPHRIASKLLPCTNPILLALIVKRSFSELFLKLIRFLHCNGPGNRVQLMAFSELG